MWEFLAHRRRPATAFEQSLSFACVKMQCIELHVAAFVLLLFGSVSFMQLRHVRMDHCWVLPRRGS